MSVSLRFRSAPQTGPSWRLRFGAEAQAPLVIAIDLGPPVVAMTVLMDPVTVSGHCAATWRDTSSAPASVQAPWVALEQVARTSTAPWAAPIAVRRHAGAPWTQTMPRQRLLAEAWNAGVELDVYVTRTWRAGAIEQRRGGGGWRQGDFRDALAALPWVSGLQLARTVVTLTQAQHLLSGFSTTPWSDGGRLHRSNRESWRDGSRQVSYGVPWTSVLVPEPPGPVCYTPSTVLRFRKLAPANTHLRFTCDHGPGPVPGVIVPIRSVYMVTNSVSLVRVVDGVPIPADSLRISLDDLSWVWGFSANVPANLLSLVEPTDEGPVELLATINGTAFRLLAEQVSRERSFGSVAIRVQGRGRMAELDDPYVAVMSFGNASPRTAQQLMADALTVGGVSLDWMIDWGLDDWLVPAGIWNHQGTYISALNTIAKAGGAYLLPHASAKSFKVLHRYPVAPWDWADVTPDLVLPVDVARRESMDWHAKPAYNRVFIAPQGVGLTGYQVTRDGTAGDLVAPLIVDALMTDAAAVRQRARAEFGQGGRQITVGLGLPVLPETGIVLPGTFIEYTDGADTKRGIARSVAVDAVFPNVWQTIGVETHV